MPELRENPKTSWRHATLHKDYTILHDLQTYITNAIDSIVAQQYECIEMQNWSWCLRSVVAIMVVLPVG